MTHPGLLVMADGPSGDGVKARLDPLLGPVSCELLQRELIRAAASYATGTPFSPCTAWFALEGELDEPLPAGVRVIYQRGADLGARIRAAVEDVYSAGHDGPLVIIGTDCPQLGPDHAANALAELARGRDAAVVPDRSGGYCLIALSRPLLSLFRLPADAWGGPAVLELTLAAARAGELDVGVLAPERCLETPDDARAAREDARVPDAVRATLLTEPLVSVIVAVQNEEDTLPRLLDRLAAMDGRFEIVVVDGNSTDDTAARARAHPSLPVVCETDAGRARQLNCGASAANGDVLLFLQSCTTLPIDAYSAIVAQLRYPDVQGGNFALAFEGEDHFSERLARWYARQRLAGVYYADSAVWVRREVFDHLGGFRPLPILEDYDFVRRLEQRGRTVCVVGPAVTSARRWRALGVGKTLWSWFVIRWLFVAGVPPKRLARLSPHPR